MGSSSSNSHHKKKAAPPARHIGNYPSTIKSGHILIEYGKLFSKKSNVALYFSRSDGTYYPPMIVHTTSDGNFSVAYFITARKPKGTYKWYAVNLKTGWKSDLMTFTVK